MASTDVFDIFWWEIDSFNVLTNTRYDIITRTRSFITRFTNIDPRNLQNYQRELINKWNKELNLL